MKELNIVEIKSVSGGVASGMFDDQIAGFLATLVAGAFVIGVTSVYLYQCMTKR